MFRGEEFPYSSLIQEFPYLIFKGLKDIRATFRLLSAFPQPTAAQSPTGRARFSSLHQTWVHRGLSDEFLCTVTLLLGTATAGPSTLHWVLFLPAQQPHSVQGYENFRGLCECTRAHAFQKGMQMPMFVTFFTCPCEPFLDLGKWICLQNFAEFLQHLEDVQDSYHEGREADSRQFLRVF